MAGVKLQLPRLPDTYDGRLIRDLVRQIEDAFARIDIAFVDGDLTIYGSGRRILGTFGGAVIADRTLFQTATPDVPSGVGVIPNGTATTSLFNGYNSSDPGNAAYFDLRVSTTSVQLSAGAFGTGALLPVTIFAGNLEAARFTTTQHTELGGTLKPKGYTVATLPAAGTVGRMAYVTDAVAPTYLGALTGGGTVKCPVFDNGTAWVAH